MAAPITTKLTAPIVAFGQPIAEFNANGYRNIAELNPALSSIDVSADFVDVKAIEANQSKLDCDNLLTLTTDQKNLAVAARDLSEKWASESEDVEVTTGKYSALHSAIKGEMYKDSAEAAAAAAQAAAGMPAISGKTGTFLGVSGGAGSEVVEFKTLPDATSSIAGAIRLRLNGSIAYITNDGSNA